MKNALQMILMTPWSRVLTPISFIILIILHLMILPAHSLGTDIGLQSFRYITPTIGFFSFLLALSESVLISLWVMLIKQRKHCRTAPAAGGIVIGLVSPLLCCTPLLPTLLGVIALVFPSVGSRYGMKIQYFVNVYQNELLVVALLLIVFSIYQNNKYLNSNSTGETPDVSGNKP